MKRQIHIRIESGLLEAFDGKLAGRERSEAVVQLIRDYVGAKPKAGDLDAADRVKIYDNEVKISKIVNDYAIKALKDRGSGVFGGLTDSELAKLVISQLPKPKDVDEDLKRDMLSLRASLEKLPSVRDVTEELNREKMENCRLRTELEMSKGVIAGFRRRIRGDGEGAWSEWREAFREVMARLREAAAEAEDRELDFDGFRVLFEKGGSWS